MSSSNCCFLTCIQISQEADQVFWYSHLFQNFPQFLVIHTVKGFGIVNKAEIDVFLELSCFFPWSGVCIGLVQKFFHIFPVSPGKPWTKYFCQPNIWQKKNQWKWWPITLPSFNVFFWQEEFSALPRCLQHRSHSYLSIIAQLTLPVLQFPVLSQCFTSRFTCGQCLWKVRREVKFTFPIGFLSQHGYMWNLYCLIVSFVITSVPSAFLPVSDAVWWPVINGACW